METMGYVMGHDELEGDEMMDGYVMGDGMQVVGRAGLTQVVRRPVVRLPAKPGWRNRSAAPGVPLPGEGLEPLPLRPQSFNGIFDNTNSTGVITFTGKSQRPFRAERLLVGVSRTATAPDIAPSQRIVTDTLFFGTTLGQLQRGDIDLELLGSPNAFGVRMQQVDVEPGVDIEIPLRLFGGALTGTQKVAVTMMWMGRSIQ
jgi:hypothetical protein